MQIWKSKKLMGVLALAMLFSFTARSSQAITVIDDDDDIEICSCWQKCCGFVYSKEDLYYSCGSLEIDLAEPVQLLGVEEEPKPMPEISWQCINVLRPPMIYLSGDGDGDGDGPMLPPDTDHDGICDSCDNCPETENGVMIPDMPKEEEAKTAVYYPMPIVDQADTDNDGVGDACDNCELTHNPDQDPEACECPEQMECPEQEECPTIPDNTGGGLEPGDGNGLLPVNQVQGTGCNLHMASAQDNLALAAWLLAAAISVLSIALLRKRTGDLK